MRFLSVPGPRDLLALVDRSGDVVEQIIGALPRIVPLVQGAERVVDEADRLFRRMEKTRQTAASLIAGVQVSAARVDSVIEGAEVTAARVDSVVDAVEAIAGRVDRIAGAVDRIAAQVDILAGQAEGVVGRAGGAVEEADAVVGRADALTRRMNGLLEELEPSLRTFQPVLDRLARTMGTREVDAMVLFLDQLPRLVAEYEGDVLPVLTNLRSVSPDIHDLLDVSRELNELLVKVPGMGRIKKKVEEEQADENGG